MSSIFSTKSTSYTLIDSLRVGDADAWRTFCELYSGLIRYWLRGLGFGPTDVEELEQDVFVFLYRRLDTFRRRARIGGFRAWLRMVTRHRAIDRIRSHKNLPAIDHSRELDELPDAATDDVDDPRRDRDERSILMSKAIELVRSEVESNTFDLFRLSFIEELPVDEIVAAKNVTPNQVYLAKSRVLTRIKRRFEDLLN
ncbi:MAG: sigma-70 family RNA polymerase sigma factor [Isosphaeraceae bacterium]|nr:sigma-70 family RNA polymerase sigma factor [Isosphaeraceae bacterium]